MKKKNFTVNCSMRAHGTRGQCVEATADLDYLHITIAPNTNHPHQIFFEKSGNLIFTVSVTANPVKVSVPSREGQNTIPWRISAKLNLNGNHDDEDVSCVAIPATQNTQWEYKLPNVANPTTLDTHITITAEEDIHPIE